MTNENIGVTGDPAGHTPTPRDRQLFARADLIAMLFFLALGVAIVISAISLKVTNALGIGPGMFPLVSGGLIGGLGLIGSIARIRQFRAPASSSSEEGPAVPSILDEGETPLESEETFTTVNWLRLGLALTLVVVFVLIVPLVGFVLALSLLTLGLMKLVARRTWVLSLVVAVGAGALTYFGFGVFLGIHMTGSSLVFFSWLDT
ncbi:MAG: Tricarboxylate transport protein TctB [Microbacteriaceae bacterium]|nr:Tricarboxylate transport protein TctB [Microbacteriaceae bacterium]